MLNGPPWGRSSAAAAFLLKCAVLRRTRGNLIVASVVDTRRSPPSPSAGPAKSRSGTPSASKANPVALGVPVIATGARPRDGGRHREPLTEETTNAPMLANDPTIPLLPP